MISHHYKPYTPSPGIILDILWLRSCLDFKSFCALSVLLLPYHVLELFNEKHYNTKMTYLCYGKKDDEIHIFKAFPQKISWYTAYNLIAGTLPVLIIMSKFVPAQQDDITPLSITQNNYHLLSIPMLFIAASIYYSNTLVEYCFTDMTTGEVVSYEEMEYIDTLDQGEIFYVSS